MTGLWPQAPGAPADRPLELMQLPMPPAMADFLLSQGGRRWSHPSNTPWKGSHGLMYTSYMYILYMCVGSLDPFGVINTGPLQGLVSAPPSTQDLHAGLRGMSEGAVGASTQAATLNLGGVWWNCLQYSVINPVFCNKWSLGSRAES